MVAVLSSDGAEVARAAAEYAGTTSQFRATLPVERPGAYEVLVYAFHPDTGNTGFDRTTFIAQSPP